MRKQLLILLLPLMLSCTLFAQEQSGDAMESLFSKDESTTAQKNETTTQAPQEKAPETEIKKLSDLAKLAPFSDVAVIQKRYLPRTGRFELYGSIDGILNDAFFNNLGVDARLAYYFREKYGIELLGMKLANSKRDVTKDLQNKEQVTTTSLVTPKSYIGVDLKWIPIYGKMTFDNEKITHFDMYFSLGAGSTSHSSGSSPTLHLGTGQNFALNKAFTFRWDFSWNIYSATSTVVNQKASSIYQNLFLGVGVSWFFPEAKYR